MQQKNDTEELKKRKRETHRRSYEKMKEDPVRWAEHLKTLRENKKRQREKLKQNPEKYNLYKQKKNEQLKKFRKNKITNKKPMYVQTVLSKSKTLSSEQIAALSWHSTRTKTLTVQETADRLGMTVTELFGATIAGTVPRPCGFNENNETAYSIEDIENHIKRKK